MLSELIKYVEMEETALPDDLQMVCVCLPFQVLLAFQVCFSAPISHHVKLSTVNVVN